jgi:hypothetical protein
MHCCTWQLFHVNQAHTLLSHIMQQAANAHCDVNTQTADINECKAASKRMQQTVIAQSVRAGEVGVDGGGNSAT